ncbi:MAG: aspartate carbamoyltransferase [Deltaproteobacteria bacterium]|nr:aspartate carbamoyltransferase [Deltaproteobacteria bacterium]
MTFAGRDLTDIHCFTKDELFYILDKAVFMKKAINERDVSSYCLARNRDLIAALLFYENSTRTRTSFEIGAMRLGLRTTGFASTEGTSVKKGESLRHTLDMYEAYNCDAIIMRHPLDGSARFAAKHLGVPVFNAGDGKHEHPTQTLLDLFTIREHIGRLEDFDMGIGGDLKYGRTAHSLAIALSKFPGVRLHFFSHADLAMPEAIMQTLKEAGVFVETYEDMREMAPKVDIFYQTRIQKERMPDLSEFERAKEMSEFTMDVLDLTREEFGLMHPLPIDKSAPSISASIDAHPKALYKEQAGNGVPTRLTELALSLGLLGEDFDGEVWAPEQVDEAFINELEIVVKPRRTDVSIRPIRENGIVIDHLQPFLEEVLVRLLRVRERRDVYRAGTVKSIRRPGTVKGMLMIEDREFSDEELRAMAAVSPGCRVNIISDGQVTRKLELRLPDQISGISEMACPNKGCITRAEYEESVNPIMIRAGEDRVRCFYCDQLMPSSGMF